MMNGVYSRCSENSITIQFMGHPPSRTALEINAICCPVESKAVISSIRGGSRLSGNPPKVIVPEEPVKEKESQQVLTTIPTIHAGLYNSHRALTV